MKYYLALISFLFLFCLCNPSRDELKKDMKKKNLEIADDLYRVVLKYADEKKYDSVRYYCIVILKIHPNSPRAQQADSILSALKEMINSPTK